MDFVASWREKRILLTGGTGFIGHHVARLGAVAGVEIHNLSSREQKDASPGVTHHHVDLKDRNQVMRAVIEIAPEAILHLAAGGVTSSQSAVYDLLQTNVIGLQAMLEAASMLPAPPPVVIAGSWFEYVPQNRPVVEDDPTWVWSPYTMSKLAAHTVAAHYARQIPITALRIFSVYGPGEPLPRLTPAIMESAVKQQPMPLTGCEQVRDYVYVVDVARAFWLALNASPAIGALRILNLGTGHPLMLRDFVNKLAAVLEAHGYPPQLEFGAKPYRSHEAMYSVADSSHITRTLGWKPLTALDEGLKQTVEHYLTRQM